MKTLNKANNQTFDTVHHITQQIGNHEVPIVLSTVNL